MLAEIRIRNLALIDELSFSLQSGLNIITGETGAGKSMIVEAVNLLIGGKADRSLVRRGCEAVEVEGLFVGEDASESTLRRVVGSDGRSRSYVDGRLATLREFAGHARRQVEIHGQHGHQVLLMPQAQLEIIDRFGGAPVDEARAEFAALSRERQEKAAKLEAIKESAGGLAERRRFLEWRVRELEEANLAAGEDRELEARIERLKNVADLRESVSAARGLLDGRAVDAVQTAVVQLERAVAKDASAGPILERLRSASADLEEAAGLAREYAEELTVDAGGLDELQERLFFLKDLIRKYGLSIEELIDRLAADREELGESSDAGALIAKLTAEVEATDVLLEAAADRLTGARRAAGERFGRAAGEQLVELAFKNARFEVACGRGTVEFLFSGSAGEPPRPLARVASGGELSRVMLAVRSVFGEIDSIPTVLFDEIDAGIGGLTAVRVGERLAGLASSRQVICVTHLASIAAFADYHLAVVKTEVKDRTRISVTAIRGEEQLLELSRLGGTVDESVASVEYARRLLDQAEEKKPASLN